MTAGLGSTGRMRAVPATLVSAFRGLPVANVSDVMARMTAAGAALRPMHAGGAARWAGADREDKAGG